MNMDGLIIFGGFSATLLIVIAAIEGGHRLGVKLLRHSSDEKESSASTIAGSILGLLAFMLAFTFGIVTDRYDARKTLVRDEANAIGTAYLRSDFLPEADREKAAALFREYVGARLRAAQTRERGALQEALSATDRIHRQLWGMAVANARKDMNSDVAALYIDSLNAVIDFHSSRVAVMQARIPTGIWVVLYALVILGMIGLGYQTAIAGSRRSWMTPVLALAFSIVIALINSLDSPHSGFITVSQQPLEALRDSMAAARRLSAQ
ncbi:MAG: hypothetical protein WCK89_16955 [bacterium]